MRQILLIVFIFTVFNSCNEQKKELKETIGQSLIVKDSIGTFSVLSLLDSGLIVNANTYKIEKSINRKFGRLEIPIKVCATFESKGYGNVDSLMLNYNGKTHKIFVKELFMSSPNGMVVLDEIKDNLIRFEDYNFDNKPDLAVYNSASGMKNILEDKYIYSKESGQFVYNKILSNHSNCQPDSVNKTIYTLGQGGMASMIYGSATYKWEDVKLVKIKTVKQDYIDSLDIFVREIKELVDTTWIMTVDTLTEQNAKEWK
ncbi:XAC2610-related protein [Carboxylicivirga taeanensis]|uniref:XAC2610-related protein n=1 Tax=Carboxylicivirga taeanensis TaxID=1416875 RepID=UPI003F6E003A